MKAHRNHKDSIYCKAKLAKKLKKIARTKDLNINTIKRSFKFKLLKTLHDSDSFVQGIVLQSDEKWCGINKTIYCNKPSDAKKINNVLTVEISVNSKSVVKTLPIKDIPHTDYCTELGFPLNNVSESYYCLNINNCAKKGNSIAIRLVVSFDSAKKYIRFSQQPTVNINIY